MSYHQTGSGVAGGELCQYSGSKLWFRGPANALDGPYVACVGMDETFGRFVEHPYPAVLQDKLRKTCVNLGSLFSGVDAILGDDGLLELINGGQMCILQLPEVHGQSNRFYRVHPRRNDRFLAPTPDLLALYPEVDFTEINFVRHLLNRLQANQDARFEMVAQELQEGWVKAMKTLLLNIEIPVFLLHLTVGRVQLVEDTLIQISDAMLGQLRQFAAKVAKAEVAVSGASEMLEDVLFGTLQQPMAEHMIGPAAHRAIADAILPDLRDLND